MKIKKQLGFPVIPVLSVVSIPQSVCGEWIEIAVPRFGIMRVTPSRPTRGADVENLAFPRARTFPSHERAGG